MKRWILISVVILSLSMATISRSSPPAPSQQLPLGVLDGATNPDMIPDHVAYTLFFRTITTSENPDEFEIRRARAFANAAGLPEIQTDEVMEVAKSYGQSFAQLDQQAAAIKDRTWPRPSSATMAELGRLQSLKEKLVYSFVASLAQRLDPGSMDQLHSHVRGIKRGVKFVPSPQTPHN